VLDPNDMGCYCEKLTQEEVSMFFLVGDLKLAKMTKMLSWCEANAYIDEMEDE